MRRICYLAVCLIAASTLLLRPAHAGTPDKAAPTRGIAVLASSIGSDFTPEALAKFVEQGKFSPVVVDWCWITYHWNHTDFAEVNRFLGLMAASKVPVAAMYRPRFLSNPSEATQVGQDGKRTVDHAIICYSDPSARKWGISWGEKILEKCPGFREIIIYNPLDLCHCPKCTAASGHTAVMNFLSEAKSAWKAKQPEVKLGVVYMPATEFWKAGMAVVDVAHPYLRIKSDIDPAEDVANIQKVRSIVKEKMGSCLGKITWEPPDKVSLEKLKTVDDLARKAGIPYFFWTYETLFKSSLYDPKAVMRALSRESSEADSSSDEPSESSRKTAEALLEQVNQAEPGKLKLEAVNAVAQRCRESNAADRQAILSVFIEAMKDKSLGVYTRWPCCYVIGRSDYEPGVAELIEVLLHDESELMRSVAAEALGKLESTKARDALLQAAKKESSQRVRATLARHLGKDTPAAEPKAVPPARTSAGGVEELAPSGPPQPPPGPERPVVKPLPWPFPGDYKAQKIYNNYQQATDSYIHCALDFLHKAGTPVTAVGSGYVAAIFTNYPQSNTHYCFIVTPEKGGNRGWCYTHLDPSTFTFKEGDFIRQGQVLGKLVDFSGTDHLHLHYVDFTREASGKVEVRSVLDPLYFFDWKDTIPPSFQPLRFISEGSEADAGGVVTVKGRVDILASITDSAYPGHVCNLGVPVVMLSISDGTHTMQKLVLDHRGDVGESRRTKPLYLTHEEKKAYLKSPYPCYHMLLVTKSDGDGKIEPEDANECWDTKALDDSGKPLWPDATYSVNVYAWDIAGNRGVVGATVQVNNGPSAH